MHNEKSSTPTLDEAVEHLVEYSLGQMYPKEPTLGLIRCSRFPQPVRVTSSTVSANTSPAPYRNLPQWDRQHVIVATSEMVAESALALTAIHPYTFESVQPPECSLFLPEHFFHCSKTQAAAEEIAAATHALYDSRDSNDIRVIKPGYIRGNIETRYYGKYLGDKASRYAVTTEAKRLLKDISSTGIFDGFTSPSAGTWYKSKAVELMLELMDAPISDWGCDNIFEEEPLSEPLRLHMFHFLSFDESAMTPLDAYNVGQIRKARRQLNIWARALSLSDEPIMDIPYIVPPDATRKTFSEYRERLGIDSIFDALEKGVPEDDIFA